MRKYAFLSAMAVCGMAFATLQPELHVPKDVECDEWAYIDRDGNVISPWYQSAKGGKPTAGAEASVWAPAYDSVCWDPITNLSGTNVYGVRPYTGFVLYNTGGTAYVHWPSYVNDIQLAPGSTGQYVQRFQYLFLHNPSGMYPIVTGPPAANATVRIWLAKTFSFGSAPAFGELEPIGIIARFTGLNSGFYRGSTTFGYTSGTVVESAFGGIKLRQGNYALVTQHGTQDVAGTAGVFRAYTAPGMGQAGFGTMMSSTEAAPFTGTNPSDSTAALWYQADPTLGLGLDVVGNNVVYDATGFEGTQWGRLSPAVLLAYDTNTVKVDGTLGYDGITNGNIPEFETFTWVAVDSNDVPLVPRLATVQAIPIDANGDFTMVNPRLRIGGTFAGLEQSRYALQAKSRTFLRFTRIVDFSGGPVSLGTIAMINGDANNDNEVSGPDFVLLDAAFNTELGDGAYNVNADFNKDDVVDGLDFVILDSNFNEEGDPAL